MFFKLKNPKIYTDIHHKDQLHIYDLTVIHLCCIKVKV